MVEHGKKLGLFNDLAALAPAAETGILFDPGKGFLERGTSCPVDGPTDLGRAHTPENADGFGIAEGQIPCAGAVFTAGILDQGLSAIGRKTCPVVEQIDFFDAAVESKFFSTPSHPAPRLTVDVKVVSGLLALQVILRRIRTLQGFRDGEHKFKCGGFRRPTSMRHPTSLSRQKRGDAPR